MIVCPDQERAFNKLPSHSYMGRIGKKRRFAIGTLITDEEMGELVRRMKSHLFLANTLDMYFGMSVFASNPKLDSGLVAFIGPHIYGESFLQVFYLRRSLESNRKSFVHNR